MNVVTLLPAATEIVYALGVEPVGVSHECDYPPAAQDLPVVEYSHVDASASSDDIDQQVHEAQSEHGSVYGIDVDLLDDLDPDLVVTQGMCDVCAVDEVLVEEAIDAIDATPEVLTTDPHSLSDIYDDIQRIGAALGKQADAADFVDSLRSRVAAVEERSRGDGCEQQHLAVLDWTDPVMVAGHWVPELAHRANCEYGMAAPGDRSIPREWDDLLRYDPDVLVVAPCGFDLDQTRRNLGDLTEREGWENLTAVQEGNVWAIDGDQYMNRPGPRAVDSLEILASVVHPEAFERPPESAAQPLSTLYERRFGTV
ncbi:ABC transporter substrate-binding protein [Haloarchaeobius sp. HME9146]|uniref:ABC transporter substrate-binding protein n=1 Tax=Haloarchaeobius sp. HME9146 TaxID=2978732 RepID=UPI0021C13402|nr:ABC transporter substrate-binding protein [Haloarchaeobius sp. HME9146]MCT9095401.1 ABC transporter substrate-binding protein [Haloarchaeobius sp. HME9146]